MICIIFKINKAVVLTELGQIVHVQLRDEDNTSDDENLGR